MGNLLSLCGGHRSMALILILTVGTRLPSHPATGQQPHQDYRPNIFDGRYG